MSLLRRALEQRPVPLNLLRDFHPSGYVYTLPLLCLSLKLSFTSSVAFLNSLIALQKPWRARELIRAENDQGNRHNDQQFQEADIKHNSSITFLYHNFSLYCNGWETSSELSFGVRRKVVKQSTLKDIRTENGRSL